MSRNTAADDAYAYGQVAAEMPELTLDDLDARTVAAAQRHAKRTHQPWPPRPASDTWTVTVRSW